MNSDKLIKVHVVIRKVNDIKTKCDTKDHESIDTLEGLNKLIRRLSNSQSDDADVDIEDVLRLCNAAKLSKEIMANAFIDVNREDMLDQEVESISKINDIINQINKHI